MFAGSKSGLQSQELYLGEDFDLRPPSLLPFLLSLPFFAVITKIFI